MAKNIGVDNVLLNRNKEEFAQLVAKATNNNGFDVCIEAVGLPSTFMNCIDAAAFGGRIVDIGVSNKNLDFNYTIIQKKELKIFGSRNALKEDFLQLIEMVKIDKVNLGKIITNVYDFEDASKVFEEFSAHAGEMLKVMIKF